MEKSLRLSVHQLVDFLLRTGDIDNRVFNRTTMSEGSRLHAIYQSEQGKNYFSEYPLKHLFIVNEMEIILEGRADGIIKRDEKDYVIDEIKTTVSDLDEFEAENKEWHLGQAKCYGLMFMMEQKLSFIGVKMTYIKQGEDKKRKVVEYKFSYLELENFVFGLLEEYLAFYSIILRQHEERNSSIANLKFPFDKFRQGQKELARYCYAISKKGGRLFAEAPTGIGKTMSTLYPFIKGMTDDEEAKIFYLTAKNSGKESAANAIRILKEKGLNIYDILITAKEKICLCKGKACNPEECLYAKGYYSKIQTLIKYALMNYSSFNYTNILDMALQYEVCPFELSLDLSLFCDVIICDYNYMFDPISYMKRYFDEDSSHYLALIDESHNLVDRSREMYSSAISYTKYLEAKKSLVHCKNLTIKRMQTKVNKMFAEMFETLNDGYTAVDNFTQEQYKVLNSVINTCQDINKNCHKEMTKELLEFYLDVNQFMKISELFNEKYVAFFIKDGKKDLCMHLNCLDASSFLRSITSRIKGATFFSATLSPIKYYIETLGGKVESDPSIILPSPFPVKNLEILVAPKVSIKYKNREKSYSQVVEYIKSFVKNKVGNYFIYVPSYEYLDHLLTLIDIPNANIYSQSREMNDFEKDAFLVNFPPHPEQTNIGILVIGGAFSEGIDLVDDRLIGAVIVGVGMPKINFISNQILEYYKKNGLPGYEYAYLNPGMNKVMQAVGRVIRSETDKGAVLLIDERYTLNEYQDLYKLEWSNYKVVYKPSEVENILFPFFNE